MSKPVDTVDTSHALPSQRSEREQEAYDAKDVGRINGSWHNRFRHIFECPNTMRHLNLFNELLSSHAKGRTVLEIGCGSGELSQQLVNANPVFVYGVDVSVGHIAEARRKEIRGLLEFSLVDISQGIEGRYGLIFGRSILHHLDFHPVLEVLYRENLVPGGAMIFLEPLGSNPLIKFYHLMSRKGHTPDEKPLVRSDLLWIGDHFQGSEVIPSNLLSFVFGVPSSFLWSTPNNLVLRWADWADSWLAAKVPLLTPYFRAAIVVIRKNRD
jgi:2-polyprenyl-3-methyl-5-hydroxy-6-metoxy-1,4-benzoquinol methylase